MYIPFNSDERLMSVNARFTDNYVRCYPLSPAVANKDNAYDI